MNLMENNSFRQKPFSKTEINSPSFTRFFVRSAYEVSTNTSDVKDNELGETEYILTFAFEVVFLATIIILLITSI